MVGGNVFDCISQKGVFARSKRTKPVIIFGVDSFSKYTSVARSEMRYRMDSRPSKGRYVHTYVFLLFERGETEIGKY